MFLTRLNELINSRGITRNKLLNELKLNANAFGNWEKRGTIPGGETLSKIADYFDVSTDYLLGRTDSMAAPARSTDDPTLASIWASCEKLNQEGKEELAKQARLLVASGEYIKTSPSGLVEGQA